VEVLGGEFRVGGNELSIANTHTFSDAGPFSGDLFLRLLGLSMSLGLLVAEDFSLLSFNLRLLSFEDFSEAGNNLGQFTQLLTDSKRLRGGGSEGGVKTGWIGIPG